MTQPTTPEEVTEFVKKITNASQADFESPDNPNSTYHDVAAIVEKVNTAMGTDIDTPNVVVVRGFSPEAASYNRHSDTMIINERTLSFQGDDEINAIIAHELGHKIRHELENDKTFDTARQVMNTVHENCPADKAPAINSILIKNGFTFNKTAEEIESSLIGKGVGEQCARETAQALQEHTDSLKEEELFSDLVAIKSGFGEGLIKTLQDGVTFYGHGINPDDLTAHPHPTERLEHAKQVIERMKNDDQRPTNDANDNTQQPSTNTDEIDLSSFSVENGGAAAGNIEIATDIPETLSTDAPTTNQPQTTIQNGL